MEKFKNFWNKKNGYKNLARKTVIAPTPYFIIQRSATIRFDTVLRIFIVLDIPINSIYKDNSYEDMETLTKLFSDKDWPDDQHRKEGLLLRPHLKDH